MTLKIEIEMDNEAFQPDNGGEAARILRALADTIDGDSLDSSDRLPGLMDVNGNRVGSATVTQDGERLARETAARQPAQAAADWADEQNERGER